jgi:hypothetical protein
MALERRRDCQATGAKWARGVSALRNADNNSPDPLDIAFAKLGRRDPRRSGGRVVETASAKNGELQAVRLTDRYFPGSEYGWRTVWVSVCELCGADRVGDYPDIGD